MKFQDFAQDVAPRYQQYQTNGESNLLTLIQIFSYEKFSTKKRETPRAHHTPSKELSAP